MGLPVARPQEKADIHQPTGNHKCEETSDCCDLIIRGITQKFHSLAHNPGIKAASPVSSERARCCSGMLSFSDIPPPAVDSPALSDRKETESDPVVNILTQVRRVPVGQMPSVPNGAVRPNRVKSCDLPRLTGCSGKVLLTGNPYQSYRYILCRSNAVSRDGIHCRAHDRIYG